MPEAAVTTVILIKNTYMNWLGLNEIKI